MEKRRVVFAAFRHRKAGKKSFSGFYSEKRERISEARKLAHPFFLYFWGQKYQKPPHDVFRGIARSAALHGRARSGLCATPRRTRRSPHPLFPRQTRVRIGGAANGGIVYFTWQCASEARSSLLFLPASGCVSLLFRKTNHPRNSIFLFPQGDSRLGSDGERADGGLKARAAGMVCLQTRE